MYMKITNVLIGLVVNDEVYILLFCLYIVIIYTFLCFIAKVFKRMRLYDYLKILLYFLYMKEGISDKENYSIVTSMRYIYLFLI